MSRKGVPKIRYSDRRKEKMEPRSSLGIVLLIFGLIFYLAGFWRMATWCLFSGFLLAAMGTFSLGLSAIIMWRIPRILATIFSLAAVLLLAAFLFLGFC